MGEKWKNNGAVNIDYHGELKVILWGDKIAILFTRVQKFFQHPYVNKGAQQKTTSVKGIT